MRRQTILDPRVIRTKNALRKALFQLLKNHLVEDITVSGLCRQANINRRTFYLHYDNVLEVFSEYEDDLKFQIRQTLLAPIHDAPALVATFNQIFEDNLIGFTYICSNHRQYILLQELENLLYDTLMSGISNQTDQSRVIMRYSCNGIINIYIYWVNHQDAYTFESMTKSLTKLVNNSFTLLNMQ
ncbi:hypothetical protein PL11_005475 [Lentilactobacillus curieae]|uniref:Uncharacterized protein n=1 Tax=Lentilactobacillus curieae TaxID=1138822 RepID=A0A1S6QII1_9LACO|nr:TetR/AcrR family transcriptional regulator C-terminal domain-containing protein [Lentilactobacillus curieae]AQW21420.1 hypothetical protein PL11_005475 [Lentilactobacillus curieae]